MIIILLLIIPMPGHADVTDGLVGWWKFDEGSGTSAADSSGYGNTGTLTNGPTWAAGKRGAAVNFDANDDFVVNAAFSWPAGSAISVAFWNYSPGGTQSSAFSVGGSGDPNRILAHAPWDDNVLYWDYGSSGGPGRITTNYAGYLNKWTHIVLVNNGTNFQAIYLNGSLITSDTSVDAAPGAQSGIWIGAFGSSYPHNGRIDDFRVYNRVLTAQEIYAIYMAGEPRMKLKGPARLTEFKM